MSDLNWSYALQQLATLAATAGVLALLGFGLRKWMTKRFGIDFSEDTD